MSRHDPEKRAEAATKPRFDLPDAVALAGAAAGRKKPGGQWIAVSGPHLRNVRAKDGRSRTGVAGISYGLSSKGAGRRSYRYFFVQRGKRSKKFNIDRLGRTVAWERALRCRAEHERRVRTANARILDARQKAEVVA